MHIVLVSRCQMSLEGGLGGLEFGVSVNPFPIRRADYDACPPGFKNNISVVCISK